MEIIAYDYKIPSHAKIMCPNNDRGPSDVGLTQSLSALVREVTWKDLRVVPPKCGEGRRSFQTEIARKLWGNPRQAEWCLAGIAIRSGGSP